MCRNPWFLCDALDCPQLISPHCGQVGITWGFKEILIKSPAPRASYGRVRRLIPPSTAGVWAELQGITWHTWWCKSVPHVFDHFVSVKSFFFIYPVWVPWIDRPRVTYDGGLFFQIIPCDEIDSKLEKDEEKWLQSWRGTTERVKEHGKALLDSWRVPDARRPFSLARLRSSDVRPPWER